MLPASRKDEIARMIPNISCESRVVTFPRVGSGRSSVRRDPDAVTICCSLVPENWPRIAWTMVVGGWIVSEYRNIFEVAAMFAICPRHEVRNVCCDATERQEATMFF